MRKRSTYLFLSVNILIVFTLQIQALAQSGGPDAYGYVWKGNATAGEPAPKWFDIGARSTVNGPWIAIDITDKFDDDSNFGPINFSFQFPYYWYKRSHIYIGSNGYISFQDNQIAAPFPAIPAVCGVSDDFMAVYATDLTLAGDGNPGKIWFYTDFKDTVVVSWENVPFFTPGSNFSGANTLQVILSKPDSSITYNYFLQSGASTGGGTTVGIESANGKTGLSLGSGVATGATAGTPKSIRFYRPSSSSYAVKDAIALWNNNPENGGQFVPINSPSPSMRSEIMNIGTVDLPSFMVNGRLFEGPTLIDSENKPSGSLKSNKDTLLALPLVLPTNAPGYFRFEAKTAYSSDEVTCNDAISQLLVVVDTAQADIDLDYTDATGGSINWTGALAGNVGMGTYLQSPIYPFKITHVLAGIAGTGTGVMVRIQDDNGKNLFGDFDGSPGDTLFQQIFPGVSAGQNALALSTPIQINSKGIYVAVLQMDQAMSIALDVSAPHSYRSYEVFNGVYSTSRFRKTQDPRIGIRIQKGEVAQVLDASLDTILEPVQEQVISAPTDVKVKITNTGPKPITEPFQVVYKAAQRAEVWETCNAVPIAVGETITYTFAQKLNAAPPPKHKYDSICVRVEMNNDYVAGNNAQCIVNESVTGIRDPAVQGQLLLFPNPASSVLYLAFNRSVYPESMVEMYGTDGRRLLHTSLDRLTSSEGFATIDLSGFGSGIYLVRMLNGQETITRKFFITDDN